MKVDIEKIRAQLKRSQPQAIVLVQPFFVKETVTGLFRKRSTFEVRCQWCGQGRFNFSMRGQTDYWIEQHIEKKCWDEYGEYAGDTDN